MPLRLARVSRERRMNYFGSYRKLLENSKSALVGAIEIYNKPTFSYRDEVFVILLLNAWELLLKAILSKNRRSIYYRKKRGEPYRTLSWSHALSGLEQRRYGRKLLTHGQSKRTSST